MRKLRKTDLFEKWLQRKQESQWIKRALTDKSYKNVNHALKDNDTNFELATYGDALIKFCYCDILLDKKMQLTKEKEKYETDKVFVEIIAYHYNLINYIDYDKNDINMVRNYDYNENDSTNHNSHKYIATAVEAMIGAIYKETNNIFIIIGLLQEWIDLIDDF